MLLGKYSRVALALLTLTFQVTAEAAEAYRAIPLSKAVEGNIMMCFRKKEKNRQVGRRKRNSIKVVRTKRHWVCSFYSVCGP